MRYRCATRHGARVGQAVVGGSQSSAREAERERERLLPEELLFTAFHAERGEAGIRSSCIADLQRGHEGE